VGERRKGVKNRRLVTEFREGGRGIKSRKGWGGIAGGVIPNDAGVAETGGTPENEEGKIILYKREKKKGWSTSIGCAGEERANWSGGNWRCSWCIMIKREGEENSKRGICSYLQGGRQVGGTAERAQGKSIM